MKMTNTPIVPEETIKEWEKLGYISPEPDFQQLCQELVDAVVIQSGHILMIRRRAEPGRGLLALPGGFLDANSDRTLEDAMIRELREETCLKVPGPVLRGNIHEVKVFDAIERSTRGRTITHAFCIKLPNGELPKVKSGTDAASAKWIPISKIDSSQCFEDHYEIINYFTGV